MITDTNPRSDGQPPCGAKTSSFAKWSTRADSPALKASEVEAASSFSTESAP